MPTISDDDVFNDKLLTEKEFVDVLNIQREHHKAISALETPKFERLLESLDQQGKSVCMVAKVNIDAKINERIDGWFDNKDWTKGLIRIKDVYCLSNYQTLLPILCKHYSHINSDNLEHHYTEDTLNAFLFKEYPELRETLGTIKAHYFLMKKDIHKIKLISKLNYSENQNSFNRFKMSVLKQLHQELKKAKPSKQEELFRKIKPLLDSGVSRKEIASTYKITEAYISILVKKYGK